MTALLIGVGVVVGVLVALVGIALMVVIYFRAIPSFAEKSRLFY